MSDSEMYVILKLTTGENVMAMFRQEDEEHVLIESPMVMKTILNFEEGKEHITAQPLCVFTKDTDFVIPKSSIMFIKRVNAAFIPHYKKIVKEHEESTLFRPRDSHEELDWADDTPTPEEAQRMIDQLDSIFGEEKEDHEIDWEEKLKMLVPGNDTLN